MSQVDIQICKVKNIEELSTSFPLEKGLYALVGENGCGKSTIMLGLSLIVKTSSSHMLKSYDITSDSSIRIQIDDKEDLWFYKSGKLTTGKFGKARKRKDGKPHQALIASTHMDGFYEGRPELQGRQTEEIYPAANPAGFGSSGTGEDIQTDYRNDGD